MRKEHTVNIDQPGIHVLPNGKILVVTSLTPEEIAYLPGHINNFLSDWVAGEITEGGKCGAHALLNVASQLLPNEFQVLDGLKSH